MAFADFTVPCVIQDKRTIPAPTGGVVTIYTDGTPFYAAIDTATSSEAVIAMQTTGREVYTVMANKNVPLYRDTYFRNERTGAYVRIMNAGMEAPAMSSLTIRQYSGEFAGMSREELPK